MYMSYIRGSDEGENMGKSKESLRKNVVNKYKLIYVPLCIALFAMFMVSISSFYISKNLLLKEVKQDGHKLVKQVTRQIEGNRETLDLINEMREEQIRRVGETVIKNEKNLNDDFLIEIMKDFHVDELNWVNEKGKILYSTIEAYRGSIPLKGQPLYDFARSNDQELMEDIRPAAKFGIPTKYGAIKNVNGYFVQVGILAENIQKLTERWSYQILVEELSQEENVVYATIVDTNFKVIADTDTEDIGVIYDNDQEKNLKEAIQVNIGMEEWYYERIQSKLLEITVPIFIDGEITGALVMGISMESVYDSIYRIFITSSSVVIMMFLIFLWVQNKNIIKPVKQLNHKINQINVENNISYRLPLDEKDTFFGLTISINKLLDKMDSYLCQLKEYQEELEASNEEIVVAYQQITETEKELRVQYDETQSYTQKLESLKQKYEIAIEGTNSAVWEIDIMNKTIYFSKEFTNIVGTYFGKEDRIDQVFAKLCTIEDKEKLVAELEQYKNGEKEEIYTQVKIKDKNGHLKWMLMRGKGIYDENKNLKIINGIFLDITTLKEQEAYIEHLAFNDHLTNLPNRRCFIEKLEESVGENKSGAVMLLDLDNFKGINDTLGHVYGDKVLKKVAQELINIKDEKVFVSRFGGDEFLVLIEQEEIVEIENYAKKIINIFKNKVIIDGNQIHISCSVGITRYPLESNDVSQLIMNADMAMYKVKDIGKDNYMFFKKEMTERLKEQIEIERILREAITQNGLKLVYQPQVCTYTGEIVGFEALLRLKNHNLSPAVFIPVAEKCGLIIEIGRWVTKEVIEHIAIWKNKGMVLKPVAINFSAKQLNDLNYVIFLEKLLKEKNIEGKYIEIEITESIFLDKKEEVIAFLNKLRGLGIKIALDDFGTGYSSISYLTFLPVDKIKLDKSLCDKFLEIENIKVMDNIISLTHSLDLEVLAEGVEEKVQYNRLKVGGCNYIQGYLFSKPVEVEEVEKIYNDDYLEKMS